MDEACDSLGPPDDLPISSGGAAESVPRFYTMSLGRHRSLQRLCGPAQHRSSGFKSAAPVESRLGAKALI